MSPLQVEAIPGPSDGGFMLLVILTWMVKLLMFAFWVVVAWRALRAHERIPRNLPAILRTSVATKPPFDAPAPKQA